MVHTPLVKFVFLPSSPSCFVSLLQHLIRCIYRRYIESFFQQHNWINSIISTNVFVIILWDIIITFLRQYVTYPYKNIQNKCTLFRMRRPICFYNFSSLIDRWEIFYKSKFYLHYLLCIIAILLLPCHLHTGLLSLLWNTIEVV